jgi:NAD(P)-dependent dehydrogenase (short-subunit alcohol dehydrogenase family)
MQNLPFSNFNQTSHKRALVVGAGQGIGLGFVRKLLALGYFDKIFTAYHNRELAANLQELETRHASVITSLQVDLTQEAQVSQVMNQIKAEVQYLDLVVNCVGVLHQDKLQPEKGLRHINAENLSYYFQVNSISAVLLAKHLVPLLKHKDPSVLATISAKVGSIGDNYLGGWYGYRASKAALNMLMRTVALEYRRTNPQTIVVLLHPGTTDTRLSKPFQRNVPPEKLFSVERTVDQLWRVITGLSPEDSGQFFSWDGSRLPW